MTTQSATPGTPAAPMTPHDHAMDAIGTEPVRRILSFYVYEASVRIWHWATALVVLALCLTGYYIGSPPQTVGGDTSALFRIGQLREWHFIASYFLGIGMLWRGYWAIVGGAHARLIYYIPFWRVQWWKELFSVLRWYLFIDRKAERWVGHNPLARASMFLMFTLGSTFMVFSGFGLYSEQSGLGSWQDKLFGWTISLAGSSMTLRSWHHWGMYVLVLFSVAHIYAAFRDDLMGRVSTISSMVSGWRTFRDYKE
jgi:Ni/Fe-hydrogenase 1 B-type cytochrome subunit